jgi:hypothetical protein
VDALFEAADLIGLMTAFIAIPRNDGSRSYGQGWGSREGPLRVDPGLLALNHCPFMAPTGRAGRQPVGPLTEVLGPVNSAQHR